MNWALCYVVGRVTLKHFNPNRLNIRTNHWSMIFYPSRKGPVRILRIKGFAIQEVRNNYIIPSSPNFVSPKAITL